VEIAWLVVPGQQRAPIFVGVDSAFAALLPQEDRQLVELPQEAPDPPQASSRLMDRLADLELPVAVVLGRARLQIRDALKLNPGSMIEMDRRVNEPVEIVVHNAVVARGEVVAIGGNYGVRIQEVISRKDRVALQASAAFRSSRAHLEQH
jgi:flagellar motor switch protein FliN/FliY